MPNSPAAATLTRCSGKCRPFVFIVPVHLPGIIIWSCLIVSVGANIQLMPGWSEATRVFIMLFTANTPNPLHPSFHKTPASGVLQRQGIRGRR